MNASALRDKTPDRPVSLDKDRSNFCFRAAAARTVTVRVANRCKPRVLSKTIGTSRKSRAREKAGRFALGDTMCIIDCAPTSMPERRDS